MTEPEHTGRYVVKVPWHTSVFLGHGKFPDVTPGGVEMSAEERVAAKEAAKEAHIKLLSKEV